MVYTSVRSITKTSIFCWKWGYFKYNLIINELLLKMSLALSIHTDFTTIEHFSQTTGYVSHKVSSNGNLLHFQDRPMISDNYLLNVFSFYDYSNSHILRVWLIKVRSWIKLYHIRTQTTKFFMICCCRRWFSNILTWTIYIATLQINKKYGCWNISVKYNLNML